MRRLLPALVVSIVLAAAAGTAPADEVVLKSGRTLAGRIVKEDDGHVTFQWRGGTMTIARDQIETIRRGPAPAGTDAPPPAPPAPPAPSSKAPPAKSPGAQTGGDTSQKPPAKKEPPRGRSPGDRLAEIVAIPLTPWEEEESSVAKGETKNYKVVRDDGRESLKEDRPSRPDGIARLYVLVQNEAGGYVFYVNGAPQYLWKRLYWHEDTQGWTLNHPDLELFQKDSALSSRLASDCCKDQNGMIAAACAEQSLSYALQKDRNSPATKERADLREKCRLAMGNESAGEALARFHELQVEIAFSRAPSQKIKFAMQRRDVLRELVAAASR